MDFGAFACFVGAGTGAVGEEEEPLDFGAFACVVGAGTGAVSEGEEPLDFGAFACFVGAGTGTVGGLTSGGFEEGTGAVPLAALISSIRSSKSSMPSSIKRLDDLNKAAASEGELLLWLSLLSPPFTLPMPDVPKTTRPRPFTLIG